MYIRNIILYSALTAVALCLIVVNRTELLGRVVLFHDEVKDLLIGVFSSLVLLLGLEYREYRRDKKTFGYLDGDYIRESRHNENSDAKVDTKWKLVDTTKDKPNVTLKYKGHREYHIPEIHYDEKWIATATIFLDERNRRYGEGIYQYTKKHESIKVDLGTYQLFVDELDNRRLYVFHHNYLPSGLSIGYEVWVRQQ